MFCISVLQGSFLGLEQQRTEQTLIRLQDTPLPEMMHWFDKDSRAQTTKTTSRLARLFMDVNILYSLQHRNWGNIFETELGFKQHLEAIWSGFKDFINLDHNCFDEVVAKLRAKEIWTSYLAIFFGNAHDFWKKKSFISIYLSLFLDFFLNLRVC